MTPSRIAWHRLFAGIAIAAIATAIASPSLADDDSSSKFLTRVVSPVFNTVGDHKAITKRAMICIAQIIKPGLVNAPTIISSDLDAGTIVANNAFTYGFLLVPVISARTTMTFEAKDGRFRIEHTAIEQLLEPATGWQPIGTWWGSGGDAAKEAIDKISKSVADCVVANSAASDQW